MGGLSTESTPGCVHQVSEQPARCAIPVNLTRRQGHRGGTETRHR